MTYGTNVALLATGLFSYYKFNINITVYYAHTNRLCVVLENIKPEVLKVQTELARYDNLSKC